MDSMEGMGLWIIWAFLAACFIVPYVVGLLLGGVGHVAKQGSASMTRDKEEDALKTSLQSKGYKPDLVYVGTLTPKLRKAEKKGNKANDTRGDLPPRNVGSMAIDLTNQVAYFEIFCFQVGWPVTRLEKYIPLNEIAATEPTSLRGDQGESITAVRIRTDDRELADMILWLHRGEKVDLKEFMTTLNRTLFDNVSPKKVSLSTAARA